MQDVIREGSLRLLATESSCDVIISCVGFKLVAHKIILSIASPVLQELLQENSSQQPTMLIFPDIAASTMSLILDYVYTGHVTLFLAQVSEFLSLVRMLKIKLEDDCAEVLANALEKQRLPKVEPFKKELDIKLKKLVPDLIPIARNNRVRERRARGLFNRVFPSPWTPRDKEVLEDPRSDRLFTCNDSNNNIETPAYTSLPKKFHFLCPKDSQSSKTSTIVSPPETGCSPNALRLDYQRFAEKCDAIPEVLKDRDKVAASDKDKYAKRKDKVTEIVPSPLNNNNTKGNTNENSASESAVIANADKRDNAADNDKEKGKKEKPFKCEDCGKQFSQLRNYKYHRSIHDGTKEFSTRCPECGKVFNDKGYLSSHMKIHRDRKEYACQHCPKRFNQRVAYNMHLRIHTGVKPHECGVCGKSFSRKMLLKQHQRVHTGERPYTCAECGKSFADRSNMSLHARLHTGVKPYSCTLCPKSFTKKHHLKTHMNFHTGLKPYSCEKCGLSFSQSSNMRTHYKKCILKFPSSNNNNNNTSSNNNNNGENDNNVVSGNS